MASKALFFGCGAMATMAGIYLIKEARKMFQGKPSKLKMRLFNKKMLLSTRCTWFLSELDEQGELGEDAALVTALRPLEDDERDAILQPDECSSMVVDYRRQSSDCRSRPSAVNDVFPDYDDTGDMVPAYVVNDDFTMIEGAAICMYLADSYNTFLPDEEHKAEYYSWIMYSASTFDSILKTLQLQLHDTLPEARDSDALAHALRGFDAFARALSETLDKQEFLCGDKFTAADVVLGFTLWWAYTLDGPALLQDYPVLINYLHRLRARPAFRNTFGDDTTWKWGNFFQTYVKALEGL